MECSRILFSGHAVRRMFERAISQEDVAHLALDGEVIARYPDDSPFPSYLILAFVEGTALHAVVARDVATGDCHIVTVYVPDPLQWEPNFRTRRQQ